MNAFSGDEAEHPKFVITTHASKLPAAVLIAANMDAAPRQLHPQDCLWASPRLAQSSPSRTSRSPLSPRQRRMIQCAEWASETESSGDCRRHVAQDVPVATARTSRAFPKEWGTPPSKLSPVQVQLAEGYGVASVTLRSWMIHRMHGAPKAAAAVRVGAHEEISTTNNNFKDNNTASRRDDEVVGDRDGVSMQTRRMLRHPDLPWAPDGGSWSHFKTKIQLEKQKRMLEKEEAERRSHALEQPCRQAVLPIVPPLLLEPVRDLLRARGHKNRPETPLSSRHLAHQLKLQQHGAKSGRGGQHREMARECDAALDKRGHRTACSDEQVEEEASQRRQILTPELLCTVAHEAELTQRLLRLGGLKKRFNELLALPDDDKKAVAAFVSQRAKIVQDIRSMKSPITARQTKALHGPAQKCTKTQQPVPPLALPQYQRTAQSLHLLLEPEHRKPYVASRRQIEIRPPRAPLAAVTRQRQLVTAIVHAIAACTISSIIQNYRTRKAVALKQQLAALTIQKLFRWKLMPYYVRQLAKAVTVLKPWMADALSRWRRRRLNRSADILRCTLVNCRQSNKITLYIRAFRQKVVRLQRNIRSFLLCTQARVIRLLKLLYIQSIGGQQALLRVSARAKMYPCHAKDRAVWRSRAHICTFDDRSGDRMVYMIGSRRYVSRYPAPSPLHSWAQFAVDLPHACCIMTEGTQAMIGGRVELGDEGTRQLNEFVKLLKDLVKKQRKLHLARMLNWKNRIEETKRLAELHNSFRKSMPSNLTPKQLQRLLGKIHEGAQFILSKKQVQPYFVFKVDFGEIEDLVQIIKK